MAWGIPLKFEHVCLFVVLCSNQDGHPPGPPPLHGSNCVSTGAAKNRLIPMAANATSVGTKFAVNTFANATVIAGRCCAEVASEPMSAPQVDSAWGRTPRWSRPTQSGTLKWSGPGQAITMTPTLSMCLETDLDLLDVGEAIHHFSFSYVMQVFLWT